MKFDILNKLTSKVQFTAEIDCENGELNSVKIGLAVKWAFKNKADLGGADLGGADLGGADLGGAYLGGADLRGADLRGAYLGGADLRGAYLGGAYLGGADLRGAYLGGADLGGADLGGAYLRGAYLRGAYLRGADLGGGAKYNDTLITKQPLTIEGLTYRVMILDTHIKIGCKFHSIEEWSNFTDEEISDMDSSALAWWQIHRDLILGMAKANGRPVENEKAEAA